MHTGVCVFVGCEVGGKGRVDCWCYVLVKVHCTVQERFVIWRIVIIVGANDRILAIACALKPGYIFAASSCSDGRDGNDLKPVERRFYDGAITQRLGAFA